MLGECSVKYHAMLSRSLEGHRGWRDITYYQTLAAGSKPLFSLLHFHLSHPFTFWNDQKNRCSESISSVKIRQFHEISRNPQRNSSNFWEAASQHHQAPPRHLPEMSPGGFGGAHGRAALQGNALGDPLCQLCASEIRPGAAVPMGDGAELWFFLGFLLGGGSGRVAKKREGFAFRQKIGAWSTVS